LPGLLARYEKAGGRIGDDGATTFSY